MKLVKLSAVRQIDRNMYMSIWSAQKNEKIKKYYDDAGNVCYDPAEYQKWHKTCHSGRRSKLRPITEYTIKELLKMDYYDIIKRNEKAITVYSKDSIEDLLSAIIKLNRSEVK